MIDLERMAARNEPMPQGLDAAEQMLYTIELNNDYFRDAVGYLKAEDEKLETVSLFDLMGVAE